MLGAHGRAMTVRTLPVLLAALAIAVPAAALAGDGPIATGTGEAPPSATAAAPPVQAGGETPEEIGAWARGVIEGRPSEQAETTERDRCAAPADDRPHGQVWAGIGTGGYREVGGVVTKRFGNCASATVAISRTEGRF